MSSRLSRQCARILERLKRGPATNRELSAIALKYTGRISELREAGHAIDCEALEGGLTRYSLPSARGDSAAPDAGEAHTPPDSLRVAFPKYADCVDCGGKIWVENGRIRHGLYKYGPAGVLVDCLGMCTP